MWRTLEVFHPVWSRTAASPTTSARLFTAQIYEFMGYATSKGYRDRVDDWELAARWNDAKLMLARVLAKTEAECGYLLGRVTKYK